MAESQLIPEGFEPIVSDVAPGTAPPGFEPISAPQPSLASRAGNFITDALTGGDRISPEDEDLGEVGGLGSSAGKNLTAGQSAKVAGALLLTPDEKAQADIIKNIVPDAEFKTDKAGNTQVKFPGDSEFAFLNKPGASFQDFATFVGQVLQFTPAGRVARGASTGGRVAAVGGASAATSVAQDKVAQAAGSEQPVDFVKAAFAGLGGGAGEVAVPVVMTFLRNLNQAGPLSRAQAQQMAQQAGLDPRAITDDFLNVINSGDFRREAAAAVRGAGAAGGSRTATEVSGEALSQQFDVPLTAGQRTREAAQISSEEAMLAGARGDSAQRVVRGFRDERQIPAVQRAGEDLAQQGGDGIPASRVDAAEQTREAVQRAATNLRGQVDEAFDAVRAAGDVRVTGQSARNILPRVNSRLSEEGFSIDELTPAAQKAIADIRKLAPTLPRARQPAGFTAQPIPAPVPTPVSLSKINRTRQFINRRFQQAGNPADRAALTIIKREFDQWVDDAVDNSLFSGDAAALDLLKNARNLRTQYGELFEQRGRADVAGRIMERIVNEPDLSNTQVSNWLFGASKIGQTDQSIRLANRLVQVFGIDSPQITAIRQANVRNIFFNPRTGQPLVSPDSPKQGFQQIVTNLDEFIDGKTAEYAGILHSPEQISELSAFRDLMRRFVPPDKTVSTSGSDLGNARAVIDGFNKMLTVFGFASGNPLAGTAVAAGARAGINFRNARQARRAVAQTFSNAPKPPTLALGQATAVTTTE